MLEWLTRVPLPARGLGFAGMIPFVGLCVLALFGSAWALAALLGYAAVILAFMGGIHWGLAMAAGTNDWERLGVSVAWPLLGWAGWLIGGAFGFLLAAAGFAGLLAYDLRVVKDSRAPAWYPALRWPLTVVVVVCLVLGAVAA